MNNNNIYILTSDPTKTYLEQINDVIEIIPKNQKNILLNNGNIVAPVYPHL